MVCIRLNWLRFALGELSISLLVIRVAVSALTVLAVTSVAHLLGPKWSGLVVGFPVNGLPVIALLHARYGPAVIMPFIRMFPIGAFGICLFNLVASWTLERIGLPATIALARAEGLTAHARAIERRLD